jgi:hypothetical protein
LTIGVATGADSAYLNQTFDVYQPQIEAKPYATSYVANTRGTTVATGGGLFDLTRNGNNGELINGPIYNSANGGSLVFDGVDDYINTGNSVSSNFSSQAVTILSYGKITGVVSKNTLISFNGIYSFFMPGNRLTTTYQLYWDSVSGWKNGSKTSWNNGEWYHFGWSISANTLKFYVNGVLDSTTTISTTFSPSGQTRIGLAGAGEYAYGNIGNLSIYNVALSDAEIFKTFQSTKKKYGL